MPSATPGTIQCPHCKATLPMVALRCQFCGAVLGKDVQRPDDAFRYQVNDRKTWQEVAYAILAWMRVIIGLGEVAQGIGFVSGVFFTFPGAMALSFIGSMGVIDVGLGIGLVTEQTWAQFLVKLVCWLNIPVGILGYLYLTVDKHPWLLLVRQTLFLGYFCLQLYVINVVGDA